MKFFITDSERKKTRSTLYHEFFRGKWYDGISQFWNKDSIYIHDDVMNMIGFDKLLFESIEKFNRYGVTEVSEYDWKNICLNAAVTDGEVLDAVRQITPWVEDSLAAYDVFTILGI